MPGGLCLPLCPFPASPGHLATHPRPVADLMPSRCRELVSRDPGSGCPAPAGPRLQKPAASGTRRPCLSQAGTFALKVRKPAAAAIRDEPDCKPQAVRSGLELPGPDSQAGSLRRPAPRTVNPQPVPPRSRPAPPPHRPAPRAPPLTPPLLIRLRGPSQHSTPTRKNKARPTCRRSPRFVCIARPDKEVRSGLLVCSFLHQHQECGSLPRLEK